MSDVAKNVTVVEVEHASEMQETLRKRLSEAQKADQDRINSVRTSVLGYVVSENYEYAKDDLQSFVESKRAYPMFQDRVARHVSHCNDLIEAIKTKRNFPGLASLSLSKQHELHERVLEHFEELKQNLRHIEKVERDNKLTDVRSTVWVLRALCIVVAGIVVAAFIADMRSGVMSSFLETVSRALDHASDLVVSRLPL